MWAIPGGGKSYYATYLILKELLRKNARKVFSNYPVILKVKPFIIKRIFNFLHRKINKKVQPLQDKIYSSYIWDNNYIYSGITDAAIFLDEAYRDFSSKESPKFTKDKHTFFATNRHNDLDIYFIAQHPARIEVIIREMTNIFYFIQPFFNPITKNPLWFTISGYLSEEEFKLRNLKTDMRFSFDRIFFNKKVANSYDSKYYRKNVEINPKRWSEVIISEYFTQKKEEKKDSQNEKVSSFFS